MNFLQLRDEPMVKVISLLNPQININKATQNSLLLCSQQQCEFISTLY